MEDNEDDQWNSKHDHAQGAQEEHDGNAGGVGGLQEKHNGLVVVTSLYYV